MSETTFDRALRELQAAPRTWLVTGAAGFVGSHLVETLLRHGQQVVGLDNFVTGRRSNLEALEQELGSKIWSSFRFIEGDVTSQADCAAACQGVDHVLHQAALGSVPRSLKDPLASHLANVDGFLKIALAARDAEVRSLVYASSSSVYGDHPGLPKVEDAIGSPLSPYAATKRVDEIYAGVLHRCYDLAICGMRYFNVVGSRQDPNGPYAAVIPRWVSAFLAGKVPEIYGDGETSRDFCPVENVVQANLLAALEPASAGKVFNVALGGQTTLNELFFAIRDTLTSVGVDCGEMEPIYQDFRAGDVRHSLANTTLAQETFGYEPGVTFREGLDRTVRWFHEEATRVASSPA